MSDHIRLKLTAIECETVIKALHYTKSDLGYSNPEFNRLHRRISESLYRWRIRNDVDFQELWDRMNDPTGFKYGRGSMYASSSDSAKAYDAAIAAERAELTTPAEPDDADDAVEGQLHQQND